MQQYLNKTNLFQVLTTSPIYVFHVMPRHHLTSLTLKYAWLLSFSDSGSVTEVVQSAAGLLLFHGQQPPEVLPLIGPEKPWAADQKEASKEPLQPRHDG